MPKKREDFSAAQLLLAVFGVIAWAVAGLFATYPRSAERIENGAAVAMAPNNLAAAGVLGFAIGGGLCFLGLGLAARQGDVVSTTPPGTSGPT
jgi:hypothetical protein